MAVHVILALCFAALGASSTQAPTTPVPSFCSLSISSACNDEENMASKVRLTYGNGKGLAELPRLVLAELGQEYEDVRWPDDDWDKEIAALKPSLPFGQVPFYEASLLLLINHV